MVLIDCPKCGKLQTAENKECVQCGIIFSKIKQSIPTPELKPEKPIIEKEKNKKPSFICKKCNTEFTGAVCPNCGQSIPVFDKGCAISLAIILSFAILLFGTLYWADKNAPDDTGYVPKVENPRKELIEKYFNAWDGSHIELTKIIKTSMNDPDSYKHVETKYGDRGDHVIVKTIFRGKNAFGGVVTNWITAKCDLNGKVIEITGQGP